MFPLPLVDGTFYLFRIFTTHWVCRLIAWCFFTSLFFLLIKLRLLHRQRVYLRILQRLAAENRLPAGTEEQERLLVDMRARGAHLARSFAFVAWHGLSLSIRPLRRDIEDYVNRLWERMESGASLARVFIWLLPILGFMGTILGITAAIDGFTGALQARQGVAAAGAQAGDTAMIMASLSGVTAGLKTAFDTTFAGLFLVIPVMFLATFLKNSESRLVLAIENFLQQYAPLRFSYKDGEASAEPVGPAPVHPALLRTMDDVKQSLDLLGCLLQDLRLAGGPQQERTDYHETPEE